MRQGEVAPGGFGAGYSIFWYRYEIEDEDESYFPQQRIKKNYLVQLILPERLKAAQ